MSIVASLAIGVVVTFTVGMVARLTVSAVARLTVSVGGWGGHLAWSQEQPNPSGRAWKEMPKIAVTGCRYGRGVAGQWEGAILCFLRPERCRTIPDKKGKDIRQMNSGEPILPGRLCLIVVGEWEG